MGGDCRVDIIWHYIKFFDTGDGFKPFFDEFFGILGWFYVENAFFKNFSTFMVFEGNLGEIPENDPKLPLKWDFPIKWPKDLKNGWKVGGNGLKHVLNHFPHFPPIFEVFWSFYGKISFFRCNFGSFSGVSPKYHSKTIKVEKILKKCMFYLKSSLDSEKRIKTWFKPIPGVEKLDIRS